MAMVMMLMLPFSTILVVKDMIVSFRKTGYSGMHTIMRFFSPALKEALIPTNLTNIGMAFALYLINKPYDSLSAALRISRSRGRLLSYRHRGLSHQRLVSLT